MSKKLIKCKSCGAKIAKTAKICPQCGAAQHTGALTACVIIAIVAIVLCIAIVSGAGSSEPKDVPSTTGTTSAATSSTDAESAEDLVISLENATITYKGCSTTPGVSGCFYVSLAIENTGNTEFMYTLSDVYADDVACTTGTGVPVVAASGKAVNGSFIVFTDKELPDISKLEFKINIMDNETLHTIETSDTVTVAPND